MSASGPEAAIPECEQQLAAAAGDIEQRWQQLTAAVTRPCRYD
jgi:hypothetical protein